MKVIHSDVIAKLYDHVGLVVDEMQIISDLEQGFLYKINGIDGRTYIRFEDEFNDVAVRIDDGEITYDTDMLFEDTQPRNPHCAEETAVVTTTYNVGSKWRVDITEDAEMYEAWLYYDCCGYKAYMWGEPKIQSNGDNPTKEDFMQRVFTRWKEYITDYIDDLHYMEYGCIHSRQ